MAEQAQTQTEALREKVDTLGHDDKEAARDFAMKAVEEAEKMLSENRADAARMGISKDDDPEVSDVLSPENVREIEVRARPFENPRVTVWLRDSPAWANTADVRTFFPKGLNAYNGKVTATIDVRPF